MATFTVAVEGFVDAIVAQRLCEHVGHSVGPVHDKRGKGNLDPKLRAYNYAAAHGDWFVLRDLDHDETCPIQLLDKLVPERAPRMILRIPVRSIESWLLADASGIARFLGVSSNLVPRVPDELNEPKAALVNLARRTRYRFVREDMVPAPGAMNVVGPGYPGRVATFVKNAWSPERAAERSESLARCLKRLSEVE